MEESLNLLYLLLLLLHKVLLVLPVGPDRLLPLLLLLVVLQTRRDGSVQPLQLVLGGGIMIDYKNHDKKSLIEKFKPPGCETHLGSSPLLRVSRLGCSRISAP